MKLTSEDSKACDGEEQSLMKEKFVFLRNTLKSIDIVDKPL